MVTNNAPLCHRHLRVKVKKHICHSRRTVEDDGKRWRRGRAGIKDCGMEGRTEPEEGGEEEPPPQIWNRKETYLLEQDFHAGRGRGGGGGWSEGLCREKGNSGLIENICGGQSGLSRRA